MPRPVHGRPHRRRRTQAVAVIDIGSRQPARCADPHSRDRPESMLSGDQHLHRVGIRRQSLGTVEPPCTTAGDQRFRRNHQSGGGNVQTVGDRKLRIGVDVSEERAPVSGPKLLPRQSPAGDRVTPSEHPPVQRW